MARPIQNLSDDELLKLSPHKQKKSISELSDEELNGLSGTSNVENDVSPSPLKIGERARLGFGNQAGSLDYLQKQGRNAEYRNGELFVDNKQADPSAFSALGDIAGSIVNPFRSLYKPKEAEQRRKNILTNIKDIPSDIAESPSDLINAGLTSGGAALGSLTGPGAIAASPAGGAAGGLASEKIKEALGKMLGVYKTEGEFLTPEAKSSAAWGTLAGLPQVIQEGRKGASFLSGKMKGLLKSSELPEKIFANATGLGDTLLDEPDVVRSLLNDDVKGSAKSLREIASQNKKSIGQEINKAIGDKTFDFADLAPSLPKPEVIASEAAPGDRKASEAAAKRVLNEFKDAFVTKEPVIDPVYGVRTGERELLKAPSLEALNAEKSIAGNAASRVYESEGAKGTAKQKAQKEIADVLRPFIEERVEGIRPLNQKYYNYQALEKGVKKVLNKDYKGNPLVQGGNIRNWLANLALGGTTGGKTRVASSLFKYANKPTKEIAKNPSFLSQLGMQALLQSLKQTGE